jgi:tryptophanyl-tRNA synthetase
MSRRERDLLHKIFTEKRTGLYAGVDPTAPSLHVGHMLPFMVLAWAYVWGLKVTFLVCHSSVLMLCETKIRSSVVQQPNSVILQVVLQVGNQCIDLFAQPTWPACTFNSSESANALRCMESDMATKASGYGGGH